MLLVQDIYYLGCSSPFSNIHSRAAAVSTKYLCILSRDCINWPTVSVSNCKIMYIYLY